jgi:hypothetical protein
MKRPFEWPSREERAEQYQRPCWGDGARQAAAERELSDDA